MSGFCTFIYLIRLHPSAAALCSGCATHKTTQRNDLLDTRHHWLLQKHLWHAAEAGEPPQCNEMAMAERWPHGLALLPAHLPTHMNNALFLYIPGLAAVSTKSVYG